MKSSKDFQARPALSRPHGAPAHLEDDCIYPIYQIENGVETYLGMFSRRARIEEYLEMRSKRQCEGPAGGDLAPAQDHSGGSTEEQKNWAQFTAIVESGDTERLSGLLLDMSEEQVRGFLRHGAHEFGRYVKLLGLLVRQGSRPTFGARGASPEGAPCARRPGRWDP